MKSLKPYLFLIALFFSLSIYAQEHKFKRFQQYCLCESELYQEIEQDSILNINITGDNVLTIDVVSYSTCYTPHFGAVKFLNDTLALRYGHEKFDPPSGFQVIGHVDNPSGIVEILDCGSNFLFGFTIAGITEIPNAILLNGKRIR
ncbi:hypothetical protein QQ020_12810 [Fulvivirgaceae bacterium BMA12]|uniref:Uncharacterized protein n=1 Tax=Agaribacillus aureus TaxID=3051825 RepID=A0ABT8L5E5_9BACT|nr:hypothetical protein [Fulvivirgaceae bacterium BMA12]